MSCTSISAQLKLLRLLKCSAFQAAEEPHQSERREMKYLVTSTNPRGVERNALWKIDWKIWLSLGDVIDPDLFPHRAL